MRQVMTIVLGACVLASALEAQVDHSPWFAGAGLGPVVQDRNGNELLDQFGVGYNVHVGRRLSRPLAAVVDLTYFYVPRSDAPPQSCGADCFLFPQKIQVVMLAGSLSAERKLGPVWVLASAGPSAHLILEAPSGDGTIYPGVEASVGGRGYLNGWLSAFVHVSYHRLFPTSGGIPQWLASGIVGVEID